MISVDEAKKIVQQNYPDGDIQPASIVYKDLYVFQVFGPDPEEGQYDPFYSVNMNTKEFAEFSVLTDGDPTEVLLLFLKAQGKEF